MHSCSCAVHRQVPAGCALLCRPLTLISTSGQARCLLPSGLSVFSLFCSAPLRYSSCRSSSCPCLHAGRWCWPGWKGHHATQGAEQLKARGCHTGRAQASLTLTAMTEQGHSHHSSCGRGCCSWTASPVQQVADALQAGSHTGPAGDPQQIPQAALEVAALRVSYVHLQAVRGG